MSSELTFGSDIILPRDPTSALQAATKQYVDTKLTGKADTTHTHNPEDLGAILLDTLGTLFSQFFESVRTLYTVEMTQIYQWEQAPLAIGIVASVSTAVGGSFIDCQSACFAPGGCLMFDTSSTVYISRYGYHEGFIPVTTINPSALSNLDSYFSIPRTFKQLHDGTVVFLTHRLNNGYWLENIALDTTVALNKRISLSSNCYYFDVVQSKSDPSKIIFLGGDYSGPVIYCSTNLGSPSKSTYSG